MAKRRRVLFVCHYSQPLKSTVLPLAAGVRARTAFEPVVVAVRDGDGVMRRLCDEAAIPMLADAPPRASPHARGDSKGGGIAARALRSYRHVCAEIRRFAGVLAAEDVRLVVLLDDCTVLGMRWIRAAERRAIPVMTVQWAAIHQIEAIVAMRAEAARARTPGVGERLFAGLVARLVPRASVLHGEERAWLFSPEMTVAHLLCGAYPDGPPCIFGAGRSTVVAMFGEGWRRRQVAQGAVDSRIVVTGHPDHDRWHAVARSWSAQERARTLHGLGIDPGRPVITVISPGLAYRRVGAERFSADLVRAMERDLVVAVEAARRASPEAEIAVKSHPKDFGRDFTIPCAREVAYRLVEDCDLERLIAASELMICHWSTTVMAALAVGTPVLLLDLRGDPSARMWKDVPGPLTVRSAEELESRIREALSSTGRAALLAQRERFTREYLCLDGGATERLVRLIAGQAEQAPPSGER